MLNILEISAKLKPDILFHHITRDKHPGTNTKITLLKPPHDTFIFDEIDEQEADYWFADTKYNFATRKGIHISDFG